MSRLALSCAVLLAAVLATPLATPNRTSWAGDGPSAPQPRLVSAVPAAGTPQVVNGAVLAFAQVGSMMVAGGSFTAVQDYALTTTYSRAHIVAFDAATGAISTTFAPALNGPVRALLAGPVAGTVYVGGTFTTADGQPAPGLVLLNVRDGSRVAGFTPGTMTPNGVLTIRQVGSQLLIGGNFRSIGGTTRGGLASLDPSTGAVTTYLTTSVSGHHNYGHVSAAELAARPGRTVAKGRTSVNRIAVSPQGNRMVVIGNFDTVGGLHRDQIALFDLASPGALLDAGWNTNRFADNCFWFAFDSWIRDVDFSPDGSYFAVASAGGHDLLIPEQDTTCDTVARFETSSSGQDVQPTWVASSGSDSFFSVAVTGAAVYAAGHPRWLNNPLSSDAQGPGAVARPGLAALDPVNGLPLGWNPGREPRGHGSQALLATPDGLWIGADSNYLGNRKYLRKKIAFFPLAGGSSPASTTTAKIPADLYLGGATSSPGTPLAYRSFDGASAGPLVAVGTPMDFSVVHAAMLIGGTLFYTKADAMLYSRTFDGTSFGPELTVNPYHDPAWDNVADSGRGTNGSLTLQGVQPDLYAQLPSLSAMAYDPTTGRMYYTLAGDPALYYRSFSPDAGVVSPIPASISGVSMAATIGLVPSGASLYYVTSDGNLHKVGLGSTAFVGSPTVVSGPGLDSVNWSANTVFAGPLSSGTEPKPTAAFTSTCTQLTCTVDGSPSSGAITSYAWDFGDGASATGAKVSHTFGTAGGYLVTLTVTDGSNQKASASHQVTVVAPVAGIDFVAATQTTANSANETVTVPNGVSAGDVLLLVASSASSTAPTAPAGWTPLHTVAATTALTTVIWERVATTADAGSRVGVGFGARHKGSVQLVAYSGTSTSSPVAGVTAASWTTSADPWASPPVTVSGAGSWVVSFWAVKSSTVTEWTAPNGQVVRSSAVGAGGGHVASLATDGGAAVAPGAHGGLVASADASATKSTTISVVLTT